MGGPRTWHEQERARLHAEWERYEGRSSTLGHVRLGLVAIILLILLLVGLGVLPKQTAWGAGASAVAFVVLVVVHARVDRARDRREAGVAFHERALTRNAPSEGTEEDPHHPYAHDLHMVGSPSILGFLSFARTRQGLKTLSSWLLAAHEPVPLEAVRARQAAARALATKPALARSLWVAGATIHDRSATALAFEWWAIARQPPVVGLAATIVAWALPALTLVALVGGELRGWPAVVTYGPYVLSIGVALGLRPRVGRISAAVVANQGGALAFADAFEAALVERFEEPTLAALQKDIQAGHTALRALRPSTMALESLENEVIRLFLAPVLQVELHAALALERWRHKHGAHASTWFVAYGGLESLASIGLLAHDFPAFAWPELVDDLRVEAEDLGHPLVPAERRVGNDVGPLRAGHALVITGSNMSGKSTLLRSIGVASAMAQAGAPVSAKRFVVGPVRLVTSMQVADSLAEGASRFYAELKRLKVVTDMAARGPGVLFLLDEMLYGTNARERLIGSRATLTWLLEHGALGAVSTHDLALAEPLDARTRNVHFEEQVREGTMSFDYKLRDGVVQSSNALRLMRELGLPVDDEVG